MEYTIKETSEKTGLTLHTLRHYTDNGLVPNIKRDRNGNRIFDDTSLNWLKAAHFLREGGLSIAEIKRYFELCEKEDPDSFEERHHILVKLKEKTVQDLAHAQFRYDCITKTLDQFEDIKAGLAKDSYNPVHWNTPD